MYKQKENIKLDPNKIEKNPGLRSLAKSKLTNFWESLDKKKTSFRQNLLIT